MEIIPSTDLFEVPGDVRIITVNTVGAMGKGIALDFKRRYPKAYHLYNHQCRTGQFWLGVPQLIETEDGLLWLLFPTKQHWRNPSQYDWLQQGLQYIIDHIGEVDYIAPTWRLVFPPLGCGNGQLDFTHVKRLMAMFDAHVPNPITLIEP